MKNLSLFLLTFFMGVNHFGTFRHKMLLLHFNNTLNTYSFYLTTETAETVTRAL